MGSKVWVHVRDGRPGVERTMEGKLPLVGIEVRDAPFHVGDRLELSNGTPVVVIREVTEPPAQFGGRWEQEIHVEWLARSTAASIRSFPPGSSTASRATS